MMATYYISSSEKGLDGGRVQGNDPVKVLLAGNREREHGMVLLLRQLCMKPESIFLDTVLANDQVRGLSCFAKGL